MTASLDQSHLATFYSSIPGRDELSKGDLANMFAYYLQVELGRASVETAELKRCFVLCDLGSPTWLATHLTNNSKGKQATYVKATKGYRLHAKERERLSGLFGPALSITQTSAPMKAIYDALPPGAQKEFLDEAIRCYAAGCNRAAVVMFWLFLLDHLFELVLKNHKPQFNATLAANTDKRIKITSVSKRDDFGDVPEGKFIEFLRTSGVISNDVRKILDQKLGTRNTAAHPSTVKLAQSKANDFFDDLIENVYKKYPL
ncbi:hypothetical protein D3C72_1013330 [compost metagenome]